MIREPAFVVQAFLPLLPFPPLLPFLPEGARSVRDADREDFLSFAYSARRDID